MYVREAHPVRTTKAPDPAKAGHGDIGRHSTMASRAIAAGKCSSGLGMKLPILLDPMKNPAYTAYKGFPAGTTVIDLDGKIQYATRGPWGTTPKGAEVVLKKLLAALPKTPEGVFTQFKAELETLGKTYPELANFKASKQTHPECINFADETNGVSVLFFIGGEKSRMPSGELSNSVRLAQSENIVWAVCSLPKKPTKGLKEKLDALIAKYTHRLVVLDQQAAAKAKAASEKTAPTKESTTETSKPAVKSVAK